MTPSGIKPATFRLVVKCLNQARHRVILVMFVVSKYLCIITMYLSILFITLSPYKISYA